MIATRLIGFLFLATTATLAAQVPVTQDPSHKVTFENAQLRIMNVNVAPGQMSLDHRHDFDNVTVSMSAGTETRVQPSGQQWGPVRPARPLGDAAITEYTGKAASHRVENVGKSAYQLFAVENLKKSGWSTAAAATGLATKMVSENRAFRIYDVRLEKATSQTAHTHAVPTLTILLSGKAMSDGPDAKAKELAPAPVGLRQLDQPGQWLYVPAGDTHHVVRLGVTDARLIEIEIR